MQKYKYKTDEYYVDKNLEYQMNKAAKRGWRVVGIT